MKDSILVFDIETIPDADGGRRLYGFDQPDDAGVVQAMAEARLAAKGTDFQPPYLQRIVAISVVLRTADELRCWSLGDEGASEAELVQRFYDGVEKYRPVLVSWNGGGFDLPVLHYRGLLHAVRAPRYWDTGYADREAKWDNYISRYQFRHTDLMDVLALYSARSYAPLDELSQLLGFPGKLGMDGSKVFEAWREGRLPEIRAYCETDVLNTYLIYLRWELMRGRLSAAQHEDELARVRRFLDQSPAAHWGEFNRTWQQASGRSSAA